MLAVWRTVMTFVEYIVWLSEVTISQDRDL